MNAPNYTTALLRSALVKLNECRTKCPGVGGDIDASNVRWMIEKNDFNLSAIERAAKTLEYLSGVLEVDATSEIAGLLWLVHMSTPPAVHDSDLKAVEEIFNKFSVGVFSTFCDDEPDFDQAEQSELVLIIARHHAEERAAGENLVAALHYYRTHEALTTEQQLIAENALCTYQKTNPPTKNANACSNTTGADAALAALRTASQSPTT